MHILLTNDDGVEAPGLRALVEVLAPHARLTVVAPDRQRSAMGLAITLHSALQVDELDPPLPGIALYRCSGTPTDCVAIAVYALCSTPPDLVISGINDGPNLGEDILYSGTVGGAIEGRILAVPSIAVSALRPTDGLVPAYQTAAQVTARLVEAWQRGLRVPEDVVLNVNVPSLTLARLSGFAVTTLGRRDYEAEVRIEHDTEGRHHYWIYGGARDTSPAPDTDVAAVASGKVSITPITYRLTAYRFVHDLQRILPGDLLSARPDAPADDEWRP